MISRCLYMALRAAVCTCICLLSYKSSAQFYIQMRGGLQANPKRVLIAPAVSYSIYGFSLTPELVIFPSNDAPVRFGSRISYTFRFLEVGYGRYYETYSTDKYDSYKNGWVNMAFVAGHWKSFFAEYGYSKSSIFSIGIRERLGRPGPGKNKYY